MPIDYAVMDVCENSVESSTPQKNSKLSRWLFVYSFVELCEPKSAPQLGILTRSHPYPKFGTFFALEECIARCSFEVSASPSSTSAPSRSNCPFPPRRTDSSPFPKSPAVHPMASQSAAPTVGRKRRVSDDESVTPTPFRRRKMRRTIPQGGNVQSCKNAAEKCKPRAILLSSPTDISDAAVIAQMQKIRTRQAKGSGLPDLSSSPLEKMTKVDQNVNQEEVSDVETQEEAEALTPRPSVRRRAPQRPPLSRRRAVGSNRARFGVGIMRCRTWRLSGEDTETEDDSPAPSPRRGTSDSFSIPASVSIGPSSCGCDEDGNGANLEDQVGTSVIPIDPSQMCFDRSFSEDQWQLRSPSPDEEFVPEHSCCVGTSETLRDDEEKCNTDAAQEKCH